jgi:hypothetical protein
MSAMISEVYDALVAAGAPEDKARKAAEAVANYENRLGKFESELTLIKWMIGFNIAVSVAVLARLFVA